MSNDDYMRKVADSTLYQESPKVPDDDKWSRLSGGEFSDVIFLTKSSTLFLRRLLGVTASEVQSIVSSSWTAAQSVGAMRYDPENATVYIPIYCDGMPDDTAIEMGLVENSEVTASRPQPYATVGVLYPDDWQEKRLEQAKETLTDEFCERLYTVLLARFGTDPTAKTEFGNFVKDEFGFDYRRAGFAKLSNLTDTLAWVEEIEADDPADSKLVLVPFVSPLLDADAASELCKSVSQLSAYRDHPVSLDVLPDGNPEAFFDQVFIRFAQAFMKKAFGFSAEFTKAAIARSWTASYEAGAIRTDESIESLVWFPFCLIWQDVDSDLIEIGFMKSADESKTEDKPLALSKANVPSGCFRKRFDQAVQTVPDAELLELKRLLLDRYGYDPVSKSAMADIIVNGIGFQSIQYGFSETAEFIDALPWLEALPDSDSVRIVREDLDSYLNMRTQTKRVATAQNKQATTVQTKQPAKKQSDPSLTKLTDSDEHKLALHRILCESMDVNERISLSGIGLLARDRGFNCKGVLLDVLKKCDFVEIEEREGAQPNIVLRKVMRASDNTRYGYWLSLKKPDKNEHQVIRFRKRAATLSARKRSLEAEYLTSPFDFAVWGVSEDDITRDSIFISNNTLDNLSYWFPTCTKEELRDLLLDSFEIAKREGAMREFNGRLFYPACYGNQTMNPIEITLLRSANPAMTGGKKYSISWVRAYSNQIGYVSASATALEYAADVIEKHTNYKKDRLSQKEVSDLKLPSDVAFDTGRINQLGRDGIKKAFGNIYEGALADLVSESWRLARERCLIRRINTVDDSPRVVFPICLVDYKQYFAEVTLIRDGEGMWQPYTLMSGGYRVEHTDIYSALAKHHLYKELEVSCGYSQEFGFEEVEKALATRRRDISRLGYGQYEISRFILDSEFLEVSGGSDKCEKNAPYSVELGIELKNENPKAWVFAYLCAEDALILHDGKACKDSRAMAACLLDPSVTVSSETIRRGTVSNKDAKERATLLDVCRAKALTNDEVTQSFARVFGDDSPELECVCIAGLALPGDRSACMDALLRMAIKQDRQESLMRLCDAILGEGPFRLGAIEYVGGDSDRFVALLWELVCEQDKATGRLLMDTFAKVLKDSGASVGEGLGSLVSILNSDDTAPCSLADDELQTVLRVFNDEGRLQALLSSQVFTNETKASIAEALVKGTRGWERRKLIKRIKELFDRETLSVIAEKTACLRLLSVKDMPEETAETIYQSACPGKDSDATEEAQNGDAAMDAVYAFVSDGEYECAIRFARNSFEASPQTDSLLAALSALSIIAEQYSDANASIVAFDMAMDGITEGRDSLLLAFSDEVALLEQYGDETNACSFDSETGCVIEKLLFEAISCGNGKTQLETDPDRYLSEYLKLAASYGPHRNLGKLFLRVASEYAVSSIFSEVYLSTENNGVSNSVSTQFVGSLREFDFDVASFEARCSMLAELFDRCNHTDYKPDSVTIGELTVCSLANAVNGYMLNPKDSARLYGLSRSAAKFDESVALCAELLVSERTDFDSRPGNRRQYCLQNFETRLRKPGSKKRAATLVLNVLHRVFTTSINELMRLTPDKTAQFFDRLASFFRANEKAFSGDNAWQGERLLSILHATEKLLDDGNQPESVSDFRSALTELIYLKWPYLLSSKSDFLLAVDDYDMLMGVYYRDLKAAGFDANTVPWAEETREKLELLADRLKTEDATAALLDWIASLEFENEPVVLDTTTQLIEYGLSSYAEKREGKVEGPSMILQRYGDKLGWGNTSALLRRFLNAFPTQISKEISEFVNQTLDKSRDKLTESDFALFAEINTLVASKQSTLARKSLNLRYAQNAKNLLSDSEGTTEKTALRRFHDAYSESVEGSFITYAAVCQHWPTVTKCVAEAQEIDGVPDRRIDGLDPSVVGALVRTSEFKAIYSDYPYGLNRRLLKDYAFFDESTREAILEWAQELAQDGNDGGPCAIADLLISTDNALNSDYARELGESFKSVAENVIDPSWYLGVFGNLSEIVRKLGYASAEGKAFADATFEAFLASHDPEWVTLGFQECLAFGGDRQILGLPHVSIVRSLYMKMRENRLFDAVARAYLDALILTTDRWPDAEAERPNMSRLVEVLSNADVRTYPLLQDDIRLLCKALNNPNATLRVVLMTFGNVACLRLSSRTDDDPINDALKTLSGYWRREGKKTLRALDGFDEADSDEVRDVQLKDAMRIVQNGDVTKVTVHDAIGIIDALLMSENWNDADKLRSQDCEPVVLGSCAAGFVGYQMARAISQTLEEANETVDSNETIESALRGIERLMGTHGDLLKLKKDTTDNELEVLRLTSDCLSEVTTKTIASDMLRFVSSAGNSVDSALISRLNRITNITARIPVQFSGAGDGQIEYSDLPNALNPIYMSIAENLNGGSLAEARERLNELERKAESFEVEEYFYDAVRVLREWLDGRAIVEVDIEDQGGFDGNVYVVVRNDGGETAKRIVLGSARIELGDRELEATPYGVETVDVRYLAPDCEEAFVFGLDVDVMPTSDELPYSVAVKVREEFGGNNARVWTVRKTIGSLQTTQRVFGKTTFPEDARSMKREKDWPIMYFAGRNREYAQLKRDWHLDDGSSSLPDGSVLVYGSKGVGKTAFAKSVFVDNRESWRNCIPVFLVCENRPAGFRVVDLLEPLLTRIGSVANRLVADREEGLPGYNELLALSEAADRASEKLQDNLGGAAVVDVLRTHRDVMSGLIGTLRRYSEAVEGDGGFKVIVFVDEVQNLLNNDPNAIEAVSDDLKALRRRFVDAYGDEMLAFCFIGCGDALRLMGSHAEAMRDCFGETILLKRFEGEKGLNATRYLLGIDDSRSDAQNGNHPVLGNVEFSESAVRFLTNYTAGHARSVRKICNRIISENVYPGADSPFSKQGKRVIFAGDISLLLRFKHGVEDEWRTAADIMEENFHELSDQEEAVLGAMAGRIGVQEASGTFEGVASAITKVIARDIQAQYASDRTDDVFDLLVNRGILRIASTIEGYSFSSEMYRRCAERIAKRRAGTVGHEPDTLELNAIHIEELEARCASLEDEKADLDQAIKELEADNNRLKGSIETYEKESKKNADLLGKAIETPTYMGDHHEIHDIENLNVQINNVQNIQNVFGAGVGEFDHTHLIPAGDVSVDRGTLKAAADSVIGLLPSGDDSDEIVEAKEVFLSEVLADGMRDAIPEELSGVEQWLDDHESLLESVGIGDWRHDGLFALAVAMSDESGTDSGDTSSAVQGIRDGLLTACKGIMRSLLVYWLLDAVDSEGDFAAAATPMCRVFEQLWKGLVVDSISGNPVAGLMVNVDTGKTSGKRRCSFLLRQQTRDYIRSKMTLGGIQRVFAKEGSWENEGVTRDDINGFFILAESNAIRNETKQSVFSFMDWRGIDRLTNRKVMTFACGLKASQVDGFLSDFDAVVGLRNESQHGATKMFPREKVQELYQALSSATDEDFSVGQCSQMLFRTVAFACMLFGYEIKSGIMGGVEGICMSAKTRKRIAESANMLCSKKMNTGELSPEILKMLVNSESIELADFRPSIQMLLLRQNTKKGKPLSEEDVRELLDL